MSGFKTLLYLGIYVGIFGPMPWALCGHSNISILYTFTDQERDPLSIVNADNVGVYVEATGYPADNITILRITPDSKVKVDQRVGVIPLSMVNSVSFTDIIDVEGTIYYPLLDGSMMLYQPKTHGKSFAKNLFPANNPELLSYAIYNNTIYYMLHSLYNFDVTIMAYAAGVSKTLAHYNDDHIGLVNLLYIPSIDALLVVRDLGGYAGIGGIYEIIDGSLALLYSFTGSDGNLPSSVLVSKDGLLYGTCAGGGGIGGGSLYAFDPRTKALRILYEFDDSTVFSKPAHMVYGENDDTIYGFFDTDSAIALFRYDVKMNTMAFMAGDYASYVVVQSIAAPVDDMLFGIIQWQDVCTNYVSCFSLFALNVSDAFTPA